MNPWNGASSSILPGCEKAIGGRRGFPGTSALSTPARSRDVYNGRIETLLTAVLVDADSGLAFRSLRSCRRAGDGAKTNGVAFTGVTNAIISADRRSRSTSLFPKRRVANSWWRPGTLGMDGKLTDDAQAGLRGERCCLAGRDARGATSVWRTLQAEGGVPASAGKAL